jgi:hypothetical protein
VATFADHLALDDLDNPGGLLVGEASLLEATDRVGGIHPMCSYPASGPDDRLSWSGAAAPRKQL